MKYLRAAVRFVSFLALSFGSYAAWFVGDFFIPNKIYWRQIIFRNWARGFIRLMNARVEVIGTPPAPPFFLVSNHLSYVDIALLRAVCEAVFVAKGEIEGWFLAGRIVGDIGNIFIDRHNRRDIPRAGAQILQRIDDGEGVIVFPEGTSSNGREILKFNSSFLEFAARNDLPVHYCAISYRTFDGEAAASETICWWDDSTLLAHIWRVFQLRGFGATIVFGDAPVVSRDRKALARELGQKVGEKFIPVI